MESLLVYDDEVTGAAPLIEAVYSSSWSGFLLGALELLREESLWEPDTDFDKVSQQIDDLMARLMGSTVMSGELGGGLPYCCPATAAYWYDAANADMQLVHEESHLYQRARSDDSDEVRNLCEFMVWLEPGDYVFTVIYGKGSNRGKFWFVAYGATFSHTLVDTYSASVTYNHTDTVEFEVTTAGMIRFKAQQSLKNPASSGGKINFEAFYVRMKNAEE